MSYIAKSLKLGDERAGVRVKGKEVLDNLIKASRGEIELALAVSKDGTPLFYSTMNEEDVDPLSASATALVGAMYSTLSLLGLSGFVHMDLKLGDSSHLIIKPLNKLLLIIKTGKDPHLGLIYLVIENFSEKIEDILAATVY